MTTETDQGKNSLEYRSLQLMGIFLGIFGIIMIIAMIFPEDFEGKITNLITGLVLLSAGAGAFFKGKFNQARMRNDKYRQ